MQVTVRVFYDWAARANGDGYKLYLNPTDEATSETFETFVLSQFGEWRQVNTMTLHRTNLDVAISGVDDGNAMINHLNCSLKDSRRIGYVVYNAANKRIV